MELAQKLLSALFPSRCILCLQTMQESAIHQRVEICLSCYQALPHNDNFCTRCALPLADDIENKVLCGRCIKRLPQFDYSLSLFRYEGEIIKLIHQLKFGEKISYARSIGEMLLFLFEDVSLPEQSKPDCIIPVPLHKKRLRQRGYNQSTEIARVISRKTGIPIAHDVVKRERNTTMQTGLKAKERHKNIRGAFNIIERKNYKHVLIIDDVVTTGSTVNELAKELKKNGVDKIGVLSIARAPVKA